MAGNLLRVLLALELALEGLDERDHVGLALAEEVNLGLEDLLVRVLLAALEEVEDREDELPVEVRQELGECRRGRGGGGDHGGRLGRVAGRVCRAGTGAVRLSWVLLSRAGARWSSDARGSTRGERGRDDASWWELCEAWAGRLGLAGGSEAQGTGCGFVRASTRDEGSRSSSSAVALAFPPPARLLINLSRFLASSLEALCMVDNCCALQRPSLARSAFSLKLLGRAPPASALSKGARQGLLHRRVRPAHVNKLE